MKSFLSITWVTAALYLSTPSLAKISFSSVPKSAPGRYVPGEYIVEVSNVNGLGARDGVSAHEELYSAMRKRSILFEVKNEFNVPDILVASSVKLGSADDAAKILAIDGVKAIRPVVRVPGPKPIDQFVVSDPKDARLPPQPLSTHLMTGVQKLHAEGNFGQGIKIGIIDSGIDWQHPTLGGALGPGNKVIGGHDFVGDNYNGTSPPVEDEDPLDCGGHGTHVAGIIGANADNEFGIVGVAPQASISAYRVFGCSGSTSDDIIVKALLRSYEDNNDVITLSLGGPDGWTEGTGSVVASRIARKGKVVTIAAGNEGASGAWYSSSPANGIDVISVGSVDNTVIPVQNATVKGVEHDPIPYLQALPFPVEGDLPVYITSNDSSITNDACDPLPDDTPDLSKFVVLVKRGTCTFVQKLDNIAAKGAKVALIYNSATGAFSPIGVGEHTAALISASDGQFLVDQVNANKAVTLTFPRTGANYNMKNEAGGLVSSFSTYGPTNDMYFKPAVSAPGGLILSTYPLKLGGFAVESGTSMATPFTAGASALILSAKGKSANVAKSIRDLLQTTATIVASSHTEGDLAQTVAQQGAGLIQVDRAIKTKTIITPGQLTLNDTANFKSSHTISIKNTGKFVANYQLGHIAAGTALTVKQDSIFPALGPVPLTKGAAGVKFSQSKVSVQPGQTTKVTVTFTQPKGVNAQQFPVYSGFITVSSKSETLKVSYLGLAASLKTFPVLDNTDAVFGEQIPVLLNSAGAPQLNATNYTMVNGDSPAIVYRLNFGTPKVRFDLVDVATTFKPTIEARGIFPFRKAAAKIGGTFGTVKTIGILSELPYVPRNVEAETSQAGGYNVLDFDGTFANATVIPAGQYRVLLRALKVTGSPSNEADYESWLSPPIGVVAP